MNLTELRQTAYLYVPELAGRKVDLPKLDLFLNNGANEVARLTKALPTSQLFTATADQGDYDLSVVVTRYLMPQKSGLWWYDGDQWKKLNPRTLKWMDENRPNWRDQDSGNPQDYFTEGDILTVVPKPDTTLSDAFKLYFYQKPDPMTAGGHYPFGHLTEISRLSILSEAILRYVVWKTLAILGKRDDFRMAENEFKREVYDKKKLLVEKPDITHDRAAKYQGKRMS